MGEQSNEIIGDKTHPDTPWHYHRLALGTRRWTQRGAPRQGALMEDVGGSRSSTSLSQETRMLRAFCFGVWTQGAPALRCITRLWCWRVLSALAFPLLTPPPHFIPLYPSFEPPHTQRLGRDASGGAGLWHMVRTSKTELEAGREDPAWGPWSGLSPR